MSPVRTATRAAAVLSVSALALTGCGLMQDDAEGPAADGDGVTKITVGASPTPHAKILEYVDKELAADAGLDLEIKTFDDYVQPNVQLSEVSGAHRILHIHRNQPGVLAEIAAVLRDHAVSIESLIQQGRSHSGGEVMVAMVTHEGPERCVAKALALLEGSDSLSGEPLVLPILPR